MLMLMLSGLRPVSAEGDWGREAVSWGQGGRPDSFQPGDIAGCGLWLSADYGVSRDQDEKVCGWSDRSGAGRDASQSVQAWQPLWVAYGIGLRPALKFDGSDDYLSDQAIAPLLSGNDVPFTVVMAVARLSDTPSSVCLMGGAGDSLSFSFWKSLRRVVGKIRYQCNDGTGVKEVSSSGDYEIEGTVVTFLHTGTWCKIYRNGSQIGSGSNNVGPIELDWFWIGKSIGTGSCWKGKLGELIIYDRALESAERVRVESYLNRRYSIY